MDIKGFADFVVDKWLEFQQTEVSESIEDLSNREFGDEAEIYVSQKFYYNDKTFKTARTKGSRSPADVFALRISLNSYILLLTQVKSSRKVNEIKGLLPDDIKNFSEFAHFVSSCISRSEYLPELKDNPYIIAYGYAGVFSDAPGRFNIVKTECFGHVNTRYKLAIDLKFDLFEAKNDFELLIDNHPHQI